MELTEVRKFDISDFDLAGKKRIGRGAFATTYKTNFKKDASICALKKSHDQNNSERNKEIEKEVSKYSLFMNRIEY